MKKSPARSLHADHPRDFRANRYVYPVLSRRAKGISIGVNLSPGKACNFDCAYCQVDRNTPGVNLSVDIDRLTDELNAMVALVTSGRIYDETKFRETPESLRRLCDIAISGDGEPTAVARFGQSVAACVEVGRRHDLDDVKLVLITNASLFHRPKVRAAIEQLMANRGEIWAKLDAGTEALYRRVARTAVPWQRILDNLREAARAWPIVIQSLFMQIDGEPPSVAEQEAYCDRLGEIVASDGRIKLVQIHTIARPPAESWVAALSNEQVDAIAERVRRRTGLNVVGYYGG